VYGFKIKKALSLLYNDHPTTDVSEKRLEFRAEIADATAFANVKTKIYYDVRHQSMLLNSDDKIYLRLNHNYYLPEKSNKKISSQRCGSFLVKKRIDRLVYLLKLLSI